VPWQQIDRQFVKQDRPGCETVWFWDTTDRGSGELLLWLDSANEIVAFQLSYEQWPSGRHYVCQWRRVTGLQTGVVDEGSRGVRLAKQSAIMRFTDVVDKKVIALLTRYFRANASSLSSPFRELIGSVLSAAAEAA
jgi:hypothetical protein